LSNAPASALQHHFESLEQQKESSTLGMWVFIAQEVLFFGGLFLTYTVYRVKYPVVFAAASHHLNVTLGAANTAVLICSSLTMALAVHAAALGRRKQIVAWLLLTVLLGGVFLGVKYVEYHEKLAPCFGDGPHAGCLAPGARFDAETIHLEGDEGREAQIYYSLYFAMTGLHALHMIIGFPILLSLSVLAWKGRYGPEWSTPVELTGLYWHFVDIVWIFLFPFLYLIH
jgi:cytochrome c oxidase subunit III